MILNTKNLNFYRTRYIRQVRLNRNNDAMSPTGVFTCEVPDALASRITHSASVTILGKYLAKLSGLVTKSTTTV